MEEKDLREMASQLSHPTGENGLAVAAVMNETNIGMTLHAIESLGISGHERILELGHGNADHLRQLLEKHPGATYSGLEMSELMYEEAKRINCGFTNAQRADFQLYDGLHVPFADGRFDRIFTVNTIYFWQEPEQLLAELYRVLRPGGRLLITYAQASFMKSLPFTSFGFNLYDHEKLEKLVSTSRFSIAASETQRELVKAKLGDMAEREFTTLSLQK